ncbi:hypothetical protein NL676_017755 [Syzygium grande]|nr:hypothetical protein NL676_017755 [Syzygium grande]
MNPPTRSAAVLPPPPAHQQLRRGTNHTKAKERERSPVRTCLGAIGAAGVGAAGGDRRRRVRRCAAGEGRGAQMPKEVVGGRRDVRVVMLMGERAAFLILSLSQLECRDRERGEEFLGGNAVWHGIW